MYLLNSYLESVPPQLVAGGSESAGPSGPLCGPGAARTIVADDRTCLTVVTVVVSMLRRMGDPHGYCDENEKVKLGCGIPNRTMLS